MNIGSHLVDSQVYVQIPSNPTHSRIPSPSNDQDDIHICGACKESFSDINVFLEHKHSGCINIDKKPVGESFAGYLTNNTSSNSSGMPSIGPQYFRVIVDRGTLKLEQKYANEIPHHKLQLEDNKESHILRSRLLESQVSPHMQHQSFQGDNSKIQSLVAHEQQTRREFQIDEEDVATLLANQLANEVVNSVNDTPCSPAREELLGLDHVPDEMIIPDHRHTLTMEDMELTSGISLSSNDNLKLDSNSTDTGTTQSVSIIVSTTSQESLSVNKLMTQTNKIVSHDEKEQETSQELSYLVRPKFVVVSKSSRGKKRHDCQVERCDFSTLYFKDLVRHMRKHTGKKSGISLDMLIRLYALVLFDTVLGERPFQCTTCQRSFSRGDKLQMHMRIHTGEKPHRCKLCDYATIDSGSLRKHMRIHNDERPYKFKESRKPFRENYPHCAQLGSNPDLPIFGSLVQHESSALDRATTKVGDNPFVCGFDNCTSAFKTSSDLKRHQRMHTGEKPFVCELCDYKCAIKSNLTVHIRLNHSETRSIKCNSHFPTHGKEWRPQGRFCEREGSISGTTLESVKDTVPSVQPVRNWREELILASSGSQPVDCKICEHVSTSKKAAKDHETVHAEEVLKCGVCLFACMGPSCMKNHLKTHTVITVAQDKQYSCKHCSYTSKQLGNLRIHMRIKHPGMKFCRKEKLNAKDPPSSSKASPSTRSSAITKSTTSKPFLYKSYRCTFCVASFVREDSWRSHIRQHQAQESNSSTIPVSNAGSNAIEILSRAAAETSATCEQERVTQSNDSFLTLNSSSLESTKDNSLNDSVSDPLLEEQSKDESSNGITYSSNKEKSDDSLEQTHSQDPSQFQPVLLYVQNADLQNMSLDETGSIIMTGHCGQYLASLTDQSALMEQLTASLQPGMQYVLSAPLEGVVGANGDSTFLQANVPRDEEITTVPLPSLIPIHANGRNTQQKHFCASLITKD
uniref:(California timema) hypothetical protein n=1 Tax=Timema californicum TaxID=61474 RepID=A0A7R9JDI6_TIMCA|nr:unnamed protein product [Timema californicum]